MEDREDQTEKQQRNAELADEEPDVEAHRFDIGRTDVGRTDVGRTDVDRTDADRTDAG